MILPPSQDKRRSTSFGHGIQGIDIEIVTVERGKYEREKSREVKRE